MMTHESITRKRIETNRRILDAAKDVFAESGFAGARIDEIALRAGVNKATIYYHIGNKKTLYTETIHGVLEKTVEKIALAIGKSSTPEEKLCCYIRTIARTIDDNPQMAPIILREMASGTHHIPDIIPMDMVQIIGMLSEILEEGVQKGVFVNTMPAIVHLMIIGSLLFYKAGENIRRQHRELSLAFNESDSENPSKFISGVEKLIIRAVAGHSEFSRRGSPSEQNGAEE